MHADHRDQRGDLQLVDQQRRQRSDREGGGLRRDHVAQYLPAAEPEHARRLDLVAPDRIRSTETAMT